MGSRRFLIFDFSCANVTDEDFNEVLSHDERSRRYFANNMLKEGVLYGGKTKRTKQKSKKTLKKKSKKSRLRKITRRRKRKT